MQREQAIIEKINKLIKVKLKWESSMQKTHQKPISKMHFWYSYNQQRISNQNIFKSLKYIF